MSSGDSTQEDAIGDRYSKEKGVIIVDKLSLFRSRAPKPCRDWETPAIIDEIIGHSSQSEDIPDVLRISNVFHPALLNLVEQLHPPAYVRTP